MECIKLTSYDKMKKNESEHLNYKSSSTSLLPFHFFRNLVKGISLSIDNESASGNGNLRAFRLFRFFHCGYLYCFYHFDHSQVFGKLKTTVRLYLCRQTRSRSSRQSTSESKNDRSGLFAAVLLTYLNGALRKNLVDLTLSLMIFKADDVTFLTRSVQFSLSDSFIPCIIKFQRLL